MTIVVVTPPAEEPITVEEAKKQSRVTSAASDAEIAAYITATRNVAENELHRYLVTQTLDAYFDRFQDEFLLPPLQSVTSITYLDSNGEEQTLPADQYVVDSKSKPARICRAYGVTWPSTYSQINSVVIRFVAGYGNAAAVPKCIKQWMLLRVDYYFDNRGSVIVGTSAQEMPRSHIDGLLDTERVMGWI